MKIIIKDKKKEYELEIDPSKKLVKYIKFELQKRFRLEQNNIKLLYNGKILSDFQTLESYQIKEGSKLIYLGIIESNSSINKANKSNISVNSENKGKNFTSQINNLVSLGYEKVKAENAIKKVEGDINKAIEILLKEKKNEKKNNFNTALLSEKKKIDNKKEELNNEINLPKELKSYGIYMKILTLKDENKMNIILKNIKEKNPSLLNQIKEYEKEFIKFLSSPITKSEVDFYMKNYRNAIDLLGKRVENGKIEIILSKRESEIINKLKKLGNFTIEEIIEAYIVGDKNENNAANYLLNKNINKEKEKILK